MIKSLSSFILFALFLSGCAAPASRWREDAFNRFDSALSAGSHQFAPEETENIRQTLELADRYYNSRMNDDAERLYRLSCQKSQLLYRNLVLSKVRQGASLLVQNDTAGPVEEVAIASVPVSISEVLKQAGDEDGHALPAPVDSISAGSSAAEPSPGHSVGKQDVPDSVPVSTSKADSKPLQGRDDDVRSSSAAVSDAADMTVDSAAAEMPPEPSLKASSGQPIPRQGKRVSKSVSSPMRGEPGRTTIYLTFDDGPSRLTLPIAAYLNSEGIAATFFALGNNVKGREKVVRDTVALGHRVGNHTFSHDLKKLNGSLHQDANEIDKTAAILDKLGGDGKMVRIPYGAATKKLASTVASEGGQIFDWDINSLDSSRRGAKDHAFIEQTVLRQLQKSGRKHIVLLFHDGAGHEATLTAIRRLVPRLKQEGYRFGLLSRSDRVAQSRGERNPIP